MVAVPEGSTIGGTRVCVCANNSSVSLRHQSSSRGVSRIVMYIRVKGRTAPTAKLLEGGGLKASLCSSCGRSNPEAMSVKAE